MIFHSYVSLPEANPHENRQAEQLAAQKEVGRTHRECVQPDSPRKKCILYYHILLCTIIYYYVFFYMIVYHFIILYYYMIIYDYILLYVIIYDYILLHIIIYYYILLSV